MPMSQPPPSLSQFLQERGGQHYLTNPAGGQQVRLSTKDYQDASRGGLGRQMQDWSKRLGFNPAQLAQARNIQPPRMA